MNQLILDFPAAPPSFNTFLGQGNRELLQVLREQREPFVYVWGPAGAGKSHLLKAWAAQAEAAGLPARYLNAVAEPLHEMLPAGCYLALDQIDSLDTDGQAELFNFCNHIRQSRQGALLIGASVPPPRLAVREDLRTRMGYCLVYEIKPLSDEEKIAALVEAARRRQIRISSDIFRYLLHHWRRDIGSLMAMLDALDRHALASHRPITLPLLKQLLQQDI
ncbi:DnaA regulatory inactivator Hda [Eikenella sp. NML120348]|uniref:DnaA regulatory inactivator Hda n=1 Tax=Eikenella sp. NML120348 TaxID=1795831 RepID=UPI0007E1F8AB|nr:DnaA regulatory inactivator Hda [Eikenella sp. NML120348]OAM40024.1 DnaA regulatory inactivator Hda [Eikenella sp. NML120348]